MDLNQITVPCVDYEASVQFYKKLGLRHIVDSPPRYARFETAAGTTLSLHRVESPVHDSGTCVYFEVEDVDATVETLVAKGLEFDTSPEDKNWLWREAYLSDPAGNRLCIYHAGPHRRYPPWRLADDAV